VLLKRTGNDHAVHSDVIREKADFGRLGAAYREKLENLVIITDDNVARGKPVSKSFQVQGLDLVAGLEKALAFRLSPDPAWLVQWTNDGIHNGSPRWLWRDSGD